MFTKNNNIKVKRKINGKLMFILVVLAVSLKCLRLSVYLKRFNLIIKQYYIIA